MIRMWPVINLTLAVAALVAAIVYAAVPASPTVPGEPLVAPSYPHPTEGDPRG